MRTTLYVWTLRNDDVGHVSLDAGSTYMSYWPASGVHAKKQIKLGQTQAGAFQRAYISDRRLEHRDCDVRLTLAGLDTNAMQQSWSSFRDSPARYHLIKHNCATVIASVLEIGSNVAPPFSPRLNIDEYASDFATRMLLRIRFMSASIQMWTPNLVLQYAYEIQRSFQARH